MNIWHICIFELRRILRIRSVLLNLFILPLLLIFILGTALSSTMGTAKEAIPGPARVGIIQTKENSGSDAISKALNTFVTSPAVADMMKVQNISTEEEAVSALRRGDLDFAVIIPSNLEEQIMKGEDRKSVV